MDDAASGRGLRLLSALVEGVLDIKERLSAVGVCRGLPDGIERPGRPMPGLTEAQWQSAARLRKIARSLSFWVRAAAFSNSRRASAVLPSFSRRSACTAGSIG